MFLSYRRADSAAMNGRITDELVADFGAGSVGMDIDKLSFSIGFRRHGRATRQRVQVKLHPEPWMVEPEVAVALVPIAVVRD